jgi:hypothetical protein
LTGKAVQAALLVLALACSACTDPTEPANSGRVYYLRNNTADPVSVVDCSPCDGTRYVIKPGRELKIPTDWTPGRFGDEERITDLTTRRTYYEYIYGAQNGQVFPVSARQSTEKGAIAHPAPVIANK